MKGSHTHGKKNTFRQGHRNQKNPYSYSGKNTALSRAMRESYRKTVYPSHEKRNRRNG